MIYLSEFIGSFFLVATVIGSGIMGNNLSPDNSAVALLGNTIATGAIPVSYTHLTLPTKRIV